jgi:hypothetical protein
MVLCVFRNKSSTDGDVRANDEGRFDVEKL